jgi:hypothetical protein
MRERDRNIVARVAAVLIVVVALIAIGWFFFKPYYARWTAAEQIEFWVAAGTFVLAVVTMWNVWVTRAVVGAEDRRHRQSFAPIVDVHWVARPVTSKHAFDENDEALIDHIEGVFSAENSGLGPALNITVQADVTWQFRRFETRDGERVSTGMATTVRPWSATASALSARDTRSTVELVAAQPEPMYSFVKAANVVVSYTDLFGNEYRSECDSGVLSWHPPVTFK